MAPTTTSSTAAVHGGNTSNPSTPSAQQQHHAASSVQRQLAEDHVNGLRLHNEMSRIYEGYMGMRAASHPHSHSHSHAHAHSHHHHHHLGEDAMEGMGSPTAQQGGTIQMMMSPRMDGDGRGQQQQRQQQRQQQELGSPQGVYQQLRDMF